MGVRPLKVIRTASGVIAAASWFSLFLLSAPASAQTEDAAADDQYLEEIVVTGSRLKRRDFSAPSPIATIEREALDFSG